MKTPFLFLLAASSIAFAAERTGTLPVGTNGKPLNFDFESGTLADWTATGKAFEGQPIKGDTVAARVAFERAAEHDSGLPADAYGDQLRAAVADGLRRLT